MKIYTKKGDSGKTSLIGGTRVPKHHLRIESYGTVDELNSYIGLIRDQNIDKKDIEVLLEIQDRLFTIGSHLASDPGKSKMVLPELFEKDITFLENEIDRMDDQLEEMRSFILPGGNTVVSYSHIARSVCRRAERVAVHLAEESEVDEKIITYLNRLSDYLFTLSRKLTKDLHAKEIAWVPKK
ncbi:cob(I)yrinic acid a,c-diamide adenosyltransferase [Vicingaceae bacterium]|nr:cob(I)yrinic acid a,c-diamide adenosyltransferase [Vicingaceae bacterium]MDB4060815.1 cob(I)yrinic acid a,c-diamide adenosyltransferase [Vicingaceae bacterium]MDC1452623.1 cob(I)yrinic acid a,c-diamide adenosyltransferase [Vicingaceae bacterium]